MKKAMVTGSFDPVTLGHLDIVKQACAKYGEVVVGMFVNPDKTYLFSEKERLDMLRGAVGELGVGVYSSSGLAVDLAKELGVDVFVRGIREGDLAYEEELARLNMEIGGVPTVFFAPSEGVKDIRATDVREKIKNKEDITGLVPEIVIKTVKNEV